MSTTTPPAMAAASDRRLPSRSALVVAMIAVLLPFAVGAADDADVTTQQLEPPYADHDEVRTCRTDGSARCTVDAHADAVVGTVSASARFERNAVIGQRGRADAMAWVIAWHEVPAGVSSVRYTIHVHIDEGALGTTWDTVASMHLATRIVHPSCPRCSRTVYHYVRGANSIEGTSWRIVDEPLMATIELTNPDGGPVPAGPVELGAGVTIVAAAVSPFVGSSWGRVSGTVTRIVAEAS